MSEGLAVNDHIFKPSPAAEVESRRCNPMMQNPASRIQKLSPGYYNYLMRYIVVKHYSYTACYIYDIVTWKNLENFMLFVYKNFIETSCSPLIE
jgi:hypothetical protein